MAKRRTIELNKTRHKVLMQKLEALKKLSKQEFSNALGEMAFDAARKAKRKVLYGTNLRQSIVVERISTRALRIASRALYAPYVEFGTGPWVRLQDLRKVGFPDSYAWQFKGKTDGDMESEPFFFASVDKAFTQGIKRVDAKIKKVLRKK